MNSTQWRRRVCKKADMPSMMMRIPNVTGDHMPNAMYTVTLPKKKPSGIKLFHVTSDSSKN